MRRYQAIPLGLGRLGPPTQFGDRLIFRKKLGCCAIALRLKPPNSLGLLGDLGHQRSEPLVADRFQLRAGARADKHRITRGHGRVRVPDRVRVLRLLAVSAAFVTVAMTVTASAAGAVSGGREIGRGD